MHIVHIEDFFHPSTGYKYNVLAKYLVRYGHKVTIVTSSLENRDDGLVMFFGKDNIDKLDKEYHDKYGVDIVRLKSKRFIRTRAVYDMKELSQTIDELKPDVLSLLMEQLPAYYYVFNYNKINFPIVLDTHMVKRASTTRLASIYRLWNRIFVSPIINKKDIRVIRCVYDNYIDECLGISLEKSPVVSFGSDLTLFHPNDKVKEEFRKKNNIKNDSIIFVYMGKVDESKGADLLSNAFLEKFETNKNIYLVVVGNNNSVNPKLIENNFNNSKNNIIRYNTQKYVDMPYYFQLADCALFPKQCSLSFFDAQACGLPVIAEKDMSVNTERLSHQNGFTFDSGDMKSLRACIQRYIDLSPDEQVRISTNAYNYVKENFDYEIQAKKYINVLIDEYNKYFNGKRESISKII